MMLGRAKIRGWKVWEQEVIHEHEMMNDPSRFRLTHETSFVREHVNPWASNKFFFYIMCFFRQILRSVRKSDYLTMRHGFISVHLAPGMNFDFQKYIKRSLEDDFKVVVGIRMVYYCRNHHGSSSINTSHRNKASSYYIVHGVGDSRETCSNSRDASCQCLRPTFLVWQTCFSTSYDPLRSLSECF